MSISLMYGFRTSNRIDGFTAKRTFLQYKQDAEEVALPINETAEEFMNRHHWERNSINTSSSNVISPSDLLRGSVLFYHDPFEPVALDDWEALV